jgi:hypothetical protein
MAEPMRNVADAMAVIPSSARILFHVKAFCESRASSWQRAGDRRASRR